MRINMGSALMLFKPHSREKVSRRLWCGCRGMGFPLTSIRWCRGSGNATELYWQAHNAVDSRRKRPPRGKLGRGAGFVGRADSRASGETRAADVRDVQLFENDERAELHRAEVRALRGGLQQHRQLQPYLTRAERRRSGDGFRSGRGNEFVSGDGGYGLHFPVGIERAGNTPDPVSSFIESG